MANNQTLSTVMPEDPENLTPSDEQQEIINVLCGYKREAQEARQSGPNPRDSKWQENLDLYWNRYDFSDKADWQAKEVMPEVPSFVDRFAAALKEALVSNYENFYTVVDQVDPENNLGNAIKRIMDLWLGMVGRGPNGLILPFPAVFEEQVKMGALTACCSTVLWSNDVPGGRVAVESTDPRFVWMDHTFRGLYRIRQFEVDRHDLLDMKAAKDNKNNPIFNTSELERLEAGIQFDMQHEQERLMGHGAQVQSTRKPIVIDEWLATVVTRDGKVVAKNSLIVVANDQYLIRGPETNPFWHGTDWVVYTPLIPVPLSPYGRTYMEDFGNIAHAFTELTNLLLDAAYVSAMKAFAIIPSMLVNPEQAASGIHPFKMFLLEDGARAQDFIQEIQLGSIDPGAFQMWSAMKNELTEASDINEVGLGQFAPNSRTSATEISAALQNSSALVRSVANTIEMRWLDPTLDLIWKTGLQHVSPKDARFARAAGPEVWNALMSQRKEMIKHPFTFRARGISQMIQKSQMLQSLLQAIQIIAQNDQLVAAFAQQVDFVKLTNLMFELSGVDIHKISKSERDKQVQNLTAALAERQAASAGAEPSPQQQAAVGGLARRLGVNAG